MEQKLFVKPFALANARKNGSQLVNASTTKWEAGLVSIHTADEVHEQMHQLLEAILAASERVAMPVAHLAIINDAGMRFINKASEPEKCI